MKAKYILSVLPALCAGELCAAPVAEASVAEKGTTAELVLIVQEVEGSVSVSINSRVYRVEDLATVPALSTDASIPYVVLYADARARWSSVALVVQALSDMGIRNIKLKKLGSRNQHSPIPSQD